MRRQVTAWGMRSAVLFVGALAACGGNSGLGAGADTDAAPAGSGGASATGGSSADGGAPGSGGVTVSGGGGSGSGGAAGSAGGLGGRTGSGGASDGAAGTGAGGAPGYGGGLAGLSGSAGLGGSAGRAGLGGVSGTGGTGGGTTGRDASVSYDVASDGSRADATLADLGAREVARDAGRTDALSAAAQEYVEVFAEPYCTRLAECCIEQGFPTPGLGPCEANELLFAKHLDDGSVVIDPATIQTILEQLRTSCDQPSYILLGSTTKGTLLSGEACEDAGQCAGTPALCRSSAGAPNGTCMTPPRGKAGDGCAVTCDDTTTCGWRTSAGKSPYSVCYEQDGLRCDTSTYTCVPLAAAGAKCDSFSDCGVHAECTNGVCVAKVKLGGDCSNGKSCDRGLQCGSAGGTAYICQSMSIAWSGSCSP